MPFKRGPATVVRQPVRKLTADSVTIGGVSLPAREGRFLTEYLSNGFNATEAARSMGINTATNGVTAYRLLRDERVQRALKGELRARRERMKYGQEDVSRYWLEIALSDPRELTQIIYVPCRHCYGEGHGYQETTDEYDQRFSKYELELARRDRLTEHERRRLDPMPPFEQAAQSSYPREWVYRRYGGTGYSTNGDPMRGPDWLTKIARIYEQVGKPVPEGLDANSDHSCPECHGDGIRTAWVASTPHLSPAAARLYNGVKVSRDGVEVRMIDRMAAMREFAEMMGMVGPRRVELTGPGGGPIDVALKKIEVRVIDADFTDITEAALSPVLEAATAPSKLNGGAGVAHAVPRVRTVPADEE